MKQILLFFLFILGYSLPILAQFEDNYSPLRFKGALPEALLRSFKDQTEFELNSQQDNLNTEEGKEFYTFSNYALSQTLRSGNVHFNDEVTFYLNRLVDYLLQDEPELRSSIKVYTTKLLIPNATCWRDGSIFVNLALLPYLESEAQLAYILSHEISHYQLKHSLSQFKKRKEIESATALEDQDSEQLFELLRFSQSQELEADISGLERLLLTDYDPQEALVALQQLQFVDDPIVNLALDFDSLFRLPVSEILDESSFYDSTEIRKAFDREQDWIDDKFFDPTDKEEENEEEQKQPDSLYSTHPSIDLRIEKLAERLSQESLSDSGKQFVFSQNEFYRIQMIGIFERVERLLRKAKYGQALYVSLRLAARLPNNLYLQEKAAKCLFWLHHFSSTKNLNDILPERLDYGKTPFTALIWTLRIMDKHEYRRLTDAFLTDRLKQFPDSEELLIFHARFLESTSESSEQIHDAYQRYLTTSPSGKHAKFAQKKLESL